MTVSFTFAQGKCTGCQACILACTIENGLAFDSSWRTVYTYNDRHYPNLPVQHLSLACNHCEHPACLSACPANAYSKNCETGFIDFDEAKCIGCRYCTWACPFSAPRYDASKGVIGKCTFCSERQNAGRLPACVELCPTGALGLERDERRGRQRKVSGFPNTILKPALSILPASERRSPLDMSAPQVGEPVIAARMHRATVAALREEWPLAVFTFLVPVLVGLVSIPPFSNQTPSVAAFVGISALAALISTGHLGKKHLAWRAMLNLKSSWLSREILLFGVLVAFGVGYLAFAGGARLVGWLVLAIGFATLISIDRVYATLPLIDSRRYHSASMILTGLFYVGVFSANPFVAAAVGGGKIILYTQRKTGFLKTGKPLRPALAALRVLVGFVVPALAWILASSEINAMIIAAILVGEMIDRLEFYAELDVLTPEKQMTIDLQKAISA